MTLQFVFLKMTYNVFIIFLFESNIIALVFSEIVMRKMEKFRVLSFLKFENWRKQSALTFLIFYRNLSVFLQNGHILVKMVKN